MSKLIPRENLQFDTSDVLTRTASSLAEALTGIAASEKKDWALSIGRLLQSIRGGRFLANFRHEWNSYRDKGKIKDDYTETDQHQECLQELLDFLDQPSPDEARFVVLKKILLVAASEAVSSRESVLPQQYMKLCRTLTSGELLVLTAVFSLAKATAPESLDATHWIVTVAEKSGLKYQELVELHERGLIERNLITPRVYSDRSGVSLGAHFRLTELGFDICTYIENYDSVVSV